MTIDALIRPLLQVPLFQGLKPLQITEIARRAGRIIYKPGDFIIREREAGDAAVLIVSGDAVRVRGPELSQPAEPIVAGSLIGEMAMLIDTEHTSTVLASTIVRALRIDRAEMLQQMQDDPDLAHHFVNQISYRLKRIADELRHADRFLAGEDAHMTAPVTHRAHRWPDAGAAVFH